MLRLQTLGGLSLIGGGVEAGQPRRRLALLARLAPSAERGVSRDELLACFWAERDADSARHSLDQLLYEMRRALTACPVAGTSTLRLDSGVIATDVGELLTALHDGSFERAAELYPGPFLQGFYLSGSAEFERWVESTRAAIAVEVRRALEALAKRAGAHGDHERAVDSWRRVVAEDPLSSRATLALMRALVDAGDRASALECARGHERIVREELGCLPDPTVTTLADALRRETAMIRASPPVRAHAEQRAGASSAPAPLASRARTTRSRRATLAWAGVALILGAAAFGVAGRVARARPTRIGSPGEAGDRSASLPAYEAYTRALDPALMRSDSGLRVAIEGLNRAIALDSAFAPAYAELAYRSATAAAFSTSATVAERRGMYARALVAARTAVALDDSSAKAHVQLGYVNMLGHDVRGAISELEHALAIDPGVPDANEDLVVAYQWAERPADALAAAQRATLSEPMSANAVAELAHALCFSHRYEEAQAQIDRLATLSPPLRRTPQYAAEILIAQRRWHDAIAVLRAAPSRERRPRALLGYALARSGARAEATKLLREMLATPVDSGSAFAVAATYAGLGDVDHAFIWLDRSFDDYSIWPVVMGPLFDDLRADRRFDAIRHRLGTR